MESRNVETVRASHRAFNSRDFDVAVSVAAEDAVYVDRARNMTFNGREGFREFMQGWVNAFSNAEIVEPSYIDAGDVVIAQFTGRGLNDGPLGPLPATGKPMMFDLCEILQFNEAGQVISGSVYYDQLSLLVQLGLAQGSPVSAEA